MNKPLAFVCACIAGAGLLVLACSTYFTIAYGHGDFEAGNFHRNTYSITLSQESGKNVRSYDARWDLVSGTEGSALAMYLNMWFVGIGLVVLGSGLFLAERPKSPSSFPF
jgi:hypothetical protein